MSWTQFTLLVKGDSKNAIGFLGGVELQKWCLGDNSMRLKNWLRMYRHHLPITCERLIQLWMLLARSGTQEFLGKLFMLHKML